VTYKDWLEQFKVIVRARGASASDRLRSADRLLRQTRHAARAGVTDWQEGEILGLRALIVEETGDIVAATRAYRRLAEFYRSYLAMYAHALASALEESALIDLRRGSRRTAQHVAQEVLRLRSQFPYYGVSLERLVQTLREDQDARNQKARRGQGRGHSRKRRRTMR